VRAGKVLGQTPVTLHLKEDPSTISLKLSGYGDEDLEVGRDTEHAIIRMHKLVVPVAVKKQPAAPTKKKPSIGLDD
jgi:hypothetical protein